MRSITLYILLITFGVAAGVQAQVNFSVYEDSLARVAPSILNAKTDSEKEAANKIFLKTIKRALEHEDSYAHPFKTLETIAILEPADGKFRLFNWNRPLNNGTYKYYCIVQTAPSRKRASKLYIFESIEEKLPQPEMTTLNIKNWYGALYYKIIPVKSKGKRVYTLLGWDGSNRLTTKKIVDVLHFPDVGAPKFGLPIFEIDDQLKSRIIFEYRNMAVMSVKYYPAVKRIIVDHLSAPDASLKGNPQFMAPDGSYDAYRFKKGKWHLEKDYNAKNDKSITGEKYNEPREIK